jgi:hypothetical protein
MTTFFKAKLFWDETFFGWNVTKEGLFLINNSVSIVQKGKTDLILKGKEMFFRRRGHLLIDCNVQSQNEARLTHFK